MYLRDIGISIVKFDEMPAHLPSIHLREAEHVVEIFLHYFPRKYALDGMAKTNLVLGHIPGAPRYKALIDVNEFVLSEFKRDEYYASVPAKQDEMVLAAIETCLLELAAKFEADASPIRNAAEKTRDCGFALKRESTLSRSSKSRRVRLCVFQHLSRQENRWTLEAYSRSGALLETVEIGKSNRHDSHYNFRKSRWDGSEFVLLDHLGKESFRYDVARLEQAALRE